MTVKELKQYLENAGDDFEILVKKPNHSEHYGVTDCKVFAQIEIDGQIKEGYVRLIADESGVILV